MQTLAALLLALMPVDTGEAFSMSYVSGYYHFCRRDHIELCSHITGPSIIPYSPVIAEVNEAVNKAIVYRVDTREEWTIEPRYGDCDDYVVTKLARLMALGFPRSAMRIAIGYLADGRLHAVLLVYTDQGVLMLNNYREAPSRWLAGEVFSTLGYSALNRWR